MKFIIRIIINAIALWLTALLIPAIQLSESLWGVLLVAVIFGIVNALLRPIIKLLSLPITIITLGLFTLVINTLMLLVTAAIAGNYLSITGGLFEKFMWAFLASIVISIISVILQFTHKRLNRSSYAEQVRSMFPSGKGYRKLILSAEID